MGISEEAQYVRTKWLMATRTENPQEWIETTNENLTVLTRVFWPFKPRRRSIAWKDVIEIHAGIFDCFSCHPMTLYFVRESEKDFRVSELMGEYPQLFERVLQIFPGFDKDKYDKVEACFPGECWELVWKHQ